MAWKLRFSKRAQKDAELLRRAGLGRQATELLNILVKNPYQNPPPFEKLSRDLKGLFSRRINKQHRIVYAIIKDEKTVEILKMWTHYE